MSFDLSDFGVNQGTVPQALQHMEVQAGRTVEKTQADDIAIKKIGECAHASGHAAIDNLLQEAATPGLFAQSNDIVGKHEPVLPVKLFDCFAASVGVVFIGPPGDRVKINVG